MSGPLAIKHPTHLGLATLIELQLLKLTLKKEKYKIPRLVQASRLVKGCYNVSSVTPA